MNVSCVSAFDNKAIIPDNEAVSAILGNAAPLWNELCAHVTENYPNITREWKHYGKAAGWTYKLLSKKRNLLFFVPREGTFRLRIVLGERGSACVETDSELPEEIKKAFRDATPYTEGRSIDIDIKQHEQLDTLKRLLKIKYEN